MLPDLSIDLLACHPEAVPTLCEWFEAEWPSYYGPEGPGCARRDLESCTRSDCLPVGVIALQAGSLCGFAALKAESIDTHAHLSPWATSGLVPPALRRRGIGRQLLAAIEEQAAKLGLERIYCATGTASTLLQRCGWQLIERVLHEGENLGVYSKALPRTDRRH
ncbi:MAG TPA: GNAT family N-acetyltransferase [Zeimonas sp.]